MRDFFLNLQGQSGLFSGTVLDKVLLESLILPGTTKEIPFHTWLKCVFKSVLWKRTHTLEFIMGKNNIYRWKYFNLSDLDEWFYYRNDLRKLSQILKKTAAKWKLTLYRAVFICADIVYVPLPSGQMNALCYKK